MCRSGDSSMEEVTELIIRPTGILDPIVYTRSAIGQVDDLLKEILWRISRRERVLITTLTKRTAEEVSSFLRDHDLKAAWLHSEVKSMERLKIVHALRAGKIDVLVGVNLLREGLDIPEVSLVAILDADKEGFLRSDRSLIQTIGRASRNVNGTVILYCETVTNSMARAIAETERRRSLQLAYNEKNNLTPKPLVKPLSNSILDLILPAKAKRSAKESDLLVLEEIVDDGAEENLQNGEGCSLEEAPIKYNPLLGSVNGHSDKKNRTKGGRKTKRGERSKADVDAATQRQVSSLIKSTAIDLLHLLRS